MTMHNLHIGPDAQINHTIGQLRTTPDAGSLSDQAKPVPGSYFGIDTEGTVTGRWTSGGEQLLNLGYSVQKTPRWLALHLAVGMVDLSDFAVFGVACKSRAPEAMTYRLCLRSASPDGFVDAFLPKHVVAFAQASTHIDALALDGNRNVPAEAEWRELILFFPPQTSNLDLIDLRVFIV